MTKTLPLLRTPLLLSLGLAALVGTTQAAEPAADWAVSGNISLVSDYLFRGISQTQHSPTWQATVEAAHSSGWYVGSFGSGVSNAAYSNSSGSEIDLYAGWRHDFGTAGATDFGLVTYWYPQAQYLGADGARIHFNTQELKAAYNLGSVNITGWVSPTRTWFGFAYDPISGERRNARGSAYLELNWNPVLSEGLTLNLHAGTQRYRGISAYNFSDLKIGLSYTHERWTLAAAISHNDGDASSAGKPVWTFFDADGSGRKVGGTRALFSASYGF